MSSTTPWMQRQLGDRENGVQRPSPGPAPWIPRLPRPVRTDLNAALSVFLVLIPQSLAYSVIVGVPPVVGLTVAAVATVAAAPFVSSPYLQTGPVAITALLTFGGLAGLAEPNTAEYVQLAALLALMVGLIRVVTGITRTGALAYLMSRPVLDAFTAAAALVIAMGQVPTMLGVEASGRGPGPVFQALSDPSSWQLEALVVGLVTAAIVQAGRRLHPLVPGILIAVVGGTLLAHLAGFDLATVGSVDAGWPVPSLALPLSKAASLVVPAAIIAIVGFAEPASIARTFAEQERSRWDPDREFVSQGMANLASGLFGGFPVGASFARSAVNRQAGAKTGWSGLLTGLLVLAMLPAVGVLSILPSAVLAGVIFGAVISLVRLKPILALRRLSRQQFMVAATTFVLTIALAPQIQYGLLVGILLSVGGHLRRELVIQLPSRVEGHTLYVRPLGVLYFGSAPVHEDRIVELLAEYPDVTEMVLNMDRLGRVDVTGALAIESLLERLRESGMSTSIHGLTPTGTQIVRRVLSETEVEVSTIDDLSAG